MKMYSAKTVGFIVQLKVRTERIKRT